MKNCPECSSENIIDSAMAIDRGDGNANVGFKIAIDERPDAFIFKQRIYSDVNTKVCGSCGYIRFYAKDLESLLEADRNRLKS